MQVLHPRSSPVLTFHAECFSDRSKRVQSLPAESCGYVCLPIYAKGSHDSCLTATYLLNGWGVRCDILSCAIESHTGDHLSWVGCPLHASCCKTVCGLDAGQGILHHQTG